MIFYNVPNYRTLNQERSWAMNCHYCCWSGGKHDNACPAVLLTARGRWDWGWNDGRDGLHKASQDLTYLLGYKVGEIAKEEAENNCFRQ